MLKRIAAVLLVIIAIAAGPAACSKGGKDTSRQTEAQKNTGTADGTGGGEVSAETAPAADKATETDYAALAERLSKEMAEGEFSEVCSLFSDTVAAQLDENSLKAAWEQTVGSIGAYAGYYDTLTAEQDGYKIVKSILEYEGGGLCVMFTFNAEGKIDGFWLNYYSIPAEPEATDSYAEKEIKIGEYELDGMLTVPAGVEKPPVVILIQGSGQHDMNETIGAAKNAPFRDLARGLAERGVASIRYNKRFYQFPERASADITIEDEVTDDAAAAIAFARDCAEVDGSRIFVLGHSLGGMLAPKIARDNPDVRGIISLAGSPRNLADIIYDQNADAVDSSSLSDDEKAKTLKQIRAEADRVKDLTDDNVENSGPIFGISAAYWLSLNKANGGGIAAELDLPMLFLQGGADFQISPEADFEAWRELLEGRKNCRFKLYDNLNHLFMKTNGRRDVAEYDAAGSVDGAVIDDIAAWIKEKCADPAS